MGGKWLNLSPIFTGRENESLIHHQMVRGREMVKYINFYIAGNLIATINCLQGGKGLIYTFAFFGHHGVVVYSQSVKLLAMCLLLEPSEVFLPTCMVCCQLHYRTLKVRYMHYVSKKTGYLVQSYQIRS